MKENNAGENTRKRKKLIYALIVSACSLLLIAATVLTVYFVTRGNDVVLETPVDPGDDNPKDPDDDKPSETPDDTKPEDPDKETGGEEVVTFVLPLTQNTCSVGYDAIYSNATLNKIYRHKGVDFTAEEGAGVYSVADGTVVEISYSEELGNVIRIDHGDGIVSSYRFVEPSEAIGAGDRVRQGQIIGTVAAPYGTEYKDGAHLHFEMEQNGASVDPAGYLDITYDEK